MPRFVVIKSPQRQPLKFLEQIVIHVTAFPNRRVYFVRLSHRSGTPVLPLLGKSWIRQSESRSFGASPAHRIGAAGWSYEAGKTTIGYGAQHRVKGLIKVSTVFLGVQLIAVFLLAASFLDPRNNWLATCLSIFLFLCIGANLLEDSFNDPD